MSVAGGGWSPEDLSKLVGAIKHCPSLHGFPEPSWTVDAVGDFIERQFGISLFALPRQPFDSRSRTAISHCVSCSKKSAATSERDEAARKHRRLSSAMCQSPSVRLGTALKIANELASVHVPKLRHRGKTMRPDGLVLEPSSRQHWLIQFRPPGSMFDQSAAPVNIGFPPLGLFLPRRETGKRAGHASVPRLIN